MRERERVRYVEFVQGRYAALYRTAFLLTGNHHTAEDLVQTTLTKVYLSWGKVMRADRPESYVRRVLANEAVSHRRRRWTRKSPRAFRLNWHEQGSRPAPKRMSSKRRRSGRRWES